MGLNRDRESTISLDAPTESGANSQCNGRSPSHGAVSFQHQLFQEWYASFEVERLTRDAAQGNTAALRALRHDVLNWIAWEESILFACERLSRHGADDVRAVSTAIHEALGIDPMLAAEMIFRTAPEVWPHIKDEVLAFAKRWHIPGKVDRAVRFMITTGRPEFAEYIWPLISNRENQVHIDALRAAGRFRPAVLGDGAPKRLVALPDEVRKEVLAEIATNSGFEGMELAAERAMTDPNPGVVVDIIQALQFRRGDRHVTDILKDASDEVWNHMARENYPDKLIVPEQNARLAALRQAEAEHQTDPIRKIGYVLEHGRDNARTGVQLAELITSADFPIRNDHARSAVHRAFEAYPEQIANALVARIAAKLELPYAATKYLERVNAIDEGPVASAALDPTTPERIARSSVRIIGPRTVGILIDQFFALDTKLQAANRQASEADRKEYHRLMDAIAASRQASFIEAFIARANSDDPERIARLADLFARHGRGDSEGVPALTVADRGRLEAIVGQWIEVLLASPGANRHQMSNVARVVERLGQAQLAGGVQRMLERDLSDWARAREEHFKSGRGGPLTPDVTDCHKLEYRRAFFEIGGETVMGMMKSYLSDVRFGVDAACVLADNWRREHASRKERRFASWYDFSEVKARRAQRQDESSPPMTCDDAEAIFAVVRELGRPDKDDAIQRHAIALAQIALGMPHGSKLTEIDRLLALPQPYAVKQGLLRAAAMAGEELPAAALLAAVGELLESAKKEPWRLDENRGELMGWIELFPFSDRPLDVIDALEVIPPEHRESWRLDRLLSAFANNPNGASLEALDVLAKRDPRLIERHEWLNALIRVGTLDAVRKLFDLVCSGTLTSRRSGLDGWRLGQHLGEFAKKFPAFRAEMLERYQMMAPGVSKGIVERALIEIVNADILMVLFRSYAADKRPFDGALREAIRNVAVGRRPAADWPGAFEEFSVPLTALRKHLFDLMVANNEQSALAEACLIKIEKLRDRHGRIEGEPRHPDIDSGRPWPKEVSGSA
jgi:hypothetical protein